uniref:Transmembrane channel-like protein n=1 Tax=Oncorhynchus kisutch TaxID=8019 RepID=A0A8C7KNY3_ONCKI
MDSFQELCTDPCDMGLCIIMLIREVMDEWHDNGPSESLLWYPFNFVWITETKRQELVNNLQSLSAGDRVRLLRATPLSLAEKTKLRKLVFSDKVGQSLLSSQVPCCSLLKRALCHIWFGCLFILSSLQLWQVALKRLGGRFGTGVLSYFLFIRTLLLFNVFLFLINGLFLVLPQAIYPPLHTPSSTESQGYLSNSLMFYGYYTNSTINTSCRPDEATAGTGCGTTSDPHMMAYNIPLAYCFTIGITFFITVFGEFIWKRFSQGVLRRRRKPVFDIARNVLELIYGRLTSYLCDIIVFLLVNCQASRKPWRASQMSTLFISLLCFPSFLGAIVSVTYTILTIKPSSGCGPFRNLPFMFHSGKQWAQELKSTNHKLAWLNWVHHCLVENPLFLFLLAGVFLMVIYIHTQVLDGQRKTISLLQKQIENEGKDKKFLITSLQAIHEKRQYPLSPSSRPQGSEVSDPDCAVFISVRNRKMFSNRKLKCSATEN